MAASEKLQIRLNPEQRERLRQIAVVRGVTASDVLKDAIAEQWFKLRVAIDARQAVFEPKICDPMRGSGYD